ncbi:MAG: ComF family protein [Candidatus Moraniibacteriota bacterium]
MQRPLIMLQKINTFFLDALFPIACLICHKKDIRICDDCVEKFPLLSFQFCPYCEKEIIISGVVCGKCKKSQLALEALICATEYQNISKLVHLFKYNFVFSLSVPLGRIIARALLKNNNFLPDFIIPIPIHKHKLKWRGFNQAELLANAVSENLIKKITIPVRTDLVFRQKKTSPQMKIKTYQERLNNLNDAFMIAPEAKDIIAGKNILLIDDIATTGATLFECAKILKSAGAKEIHGAIIARQKI